MDLGRHRNYKHIRLYLLNSNVFNVKIPTIFKRMHVHIGPKYHLAGLSDKPFQELQYTRHIKNLIAKIV